MKTIMNFCSALGLLLASLTLSAQPFLIKTLSNDTLNRWMTTTNQIKPFSELLDSMHETEAEALAFEALPAVEQDQRVDEFLMQHKVADKMTALVKAQGWNSVGDYMRTSAQFGNAIAAYFQEDIIANLPPEQAKAMREKTDPAIASVTKADLEFVRKNIATIQKFMQDYSGVIQ